MESQQSHRDGRLHPDLLMGSLMFVICKGRLAASLQSKLFFGRFTYLCSDQVRKEHRSRPH